MLSVPVVPRLARTGGQVGVFSGVGDLRAVDRALRSLQVVSVGGHRLAGRLVVQVGAGPAGDAAVRVEIPLLLHQIPSLQSDHAASVAQRGPQDHVHSLAGQRGGDGAFFVLVGGWVPLPGVDVPREVADEHPAVGVQLLVERGNRAGYRSCLDRLEANSAILGVVVDEVGVVPNYELARSYRRCRDYLVVSREHCSHSL